jgi:hypothetical protein
MAPLILILLAIVILVVHFATRTSGSNKKLYVISVDTSMDNAYKAIKQYSKHDFKLDYTTNDELTMKTWLNIDNAIAIDIRKVSPRRCKVFIASKSKINGEYIWVDPNLYVSDILNALNKANYTTH